MISLCCFSKNRPMQLDAFLKSLVNAPYITDTVVLYTYDDDKFEQGYNKVAGWHENVQFIKEHEDRGEWKNTILRLVESFKDYFCWATDDSIFFKHSELLLEKLNWVFKEKEALALNLRMGLNIKWQNHWYGERSLDIDIMDQYEDIVLWDASKYSVETDIGRVWQNDASIMPRDKYLQRLKAENHWYKGRGCRGLDNVGQSGRIFDPCLMAAFEHSVYLNIPVNLVHLLDSGRLYADNWGRFIKQDVSDLQNKFNEGLRIDWRKIDVSELECGRREAVYEFI